jgi:SAM-dependent methyltransferase
MGAGRAVQMGTAAVQGELWSSAAEDWATLQEPFALPLWLATLDAAEIGSGVRFLDAGCGAGGACVCAARRGALVSGLDASPAMLQIAQRRVPDGGFQVGDLASLPYPDCAFDAIIVLDALPYAPDAAVALRELRRVCVPGGQIVAATWGAPGLCQMRAVFQAIMAALPALPPGNSPFAHSHPGALEQLLEQADLPLLDTGDVICVCDYPDRYRAWQALRSTGPLQAALRVVGETYLESAVLQALLPYGGSGGAVCLEQQFHYVMTTPDRASRPTRFPVGS